MGRRRGPSCKFSNSEDEGRNANPCNKEKTTSTNAITVLLRLIFLNINKGLLSSEWNSSWTEELWNCEVWHVCKIARQKFIGLATNYIAFRNCVRAMAINIGSVHLYLLVQIVWLVRSRSWPLARETSPVAFLESVFIFGVLDWDLTIKLSFIDTSILPFCFLFYIYLRRLQGTICKSAHNFAIVSG